MCVVGFNTFCQMNHPDLLCACLHMYTPRLPDHSRPGCLFDTCIFKTTSVSLHVCQTHIQTTQLDGAHGLQHEKLYGIAAKLPAWLNVKRQRRAAGIPCQLISGCWKNRFFPKAAVTQTLCKAIIRQDLSWSPCG